MSRKSNLAVVDSVEETEIVPHDESSETATSADVAAVEPALAEAPAKREKAAVHAGDIEDVGPPPSRIIKKSLADLIAEIPVGKSRLIYGTTARGVTRAANLAGKEIASAVEGDATRVWVTGDAPAAVQEVAGE